MNETGPDKKSYKLPVSSNEKKHDSGLTESDRKALSRFFSFGVEFAGVICLFCYFGYKADQYFETMPWFTIAGILLAIVGLVYQLIKDLGTLD